MKFPEQRSVWISVVAGIAFAFSIIVIPYCFGAYRNIYVLALPLINTAFFIFLVIKWFIDRRKGKWANSGNKPLLIRSLILLIITGVFNYMPMSEAYRSAIIFLNKGREPLLANMQMLHEFEAFTREMDSGNCENALQHALLSNNAGLTWLFGELSPDEKAYITIGYSSALSTIDKANDPQAQLNQLFNEKVNVDRRSELWKISSTYDIVYDAYDCLAEQETANGKLQSAYQLYQDADSVINIVLDRNAYWEEQKAWSKSKLASAAAALGNFVLADSLFNRSVDVYIEAYDSVDVNAAALFGNWAIAMTQGQYWDYSNKLARSAIRLMVSDTLDSERVAQRLRYQLLVARNYIFLDSLPAAKRQIEICTDTKNAIDLTHCQVLLVNGSIHFRLDEFKEAETSYIDALSCLTAKETTDGSAQALTHISLAYVYAATAEYAKARVQLNNATTIANSLGGNIMNIRAGAMQLSASLYHLLGEYTTAEKEYNSCIHMLSDGTNGIANRLPGVLSGKAELLLDLALFDAGRSLADSALYMMVDSIALIAPSQTSVLNTLAHAKYCLGELGSAEKDHALVMHVAEEYGATRTATYCNALNGLGLIALERKQHNKADSLFNKAFSLSREIYGMEHPFTARVLINQALLRMQQGMYIEARSMLTTAKPITIRYLGDDHDQLGDIHSALGDIEKRTGDPNKANGHFKEALRIYSSCFTSTHPKVIAMQQRIH